MTLALFCFACRGRRPHAVSGSSAECQSCGTRRPVEGDLLPAEPHETPVLDMRFCRWCNATRPADHTCPAGAVGCAVNHPDDPPCGACDGCVAAQVADLTRYGSPIDLDHPRTP